MKLELLKLNFHGARVLLQPKLTTMNVSFVFLLTKLMKSTISILYNEDKFLKYSHFILFLSLPGS